MIHMEVLLWIVLPGFAAVVTAVLAWFVMQSRMDVALARERENLAEARGVLKAEKEAVRTSFDTAMHAAEESAKREAFEKFLGDLRVEQRHYTRDNRLLTQNRKSLVLQERMYFRNIPLSDWIEHEIMLENGADVGRLVQDMTIFDKAVVSINDAPRPIKQLA